LGKAANNLSNGLGMIEGLPAGPDTEYGGGTSPDDNDNSGILKYIRIEFGGYAYQVDKEINGLTMGSVGRNTVIDYVQTSFVNDDAFEWFGGTVNAKHLVSYRNLDDDLDCDFGFRGSVQYALIVRDRKSPTSLPVLLPKVLSATTTVPATTPHPKPLLSSPT
jgi:hypothetical protein